MSLYQPLLNTVAESAGVNGMRICMQVAQLLADPTISCCHAYKGGAIHTPCHDFPAPFCMTQQLPQAASVQHQAQIPCWPRPPAALAPAAEAAFAGLQHAQVLHGSGCCAALPQSLLLAARTSAVQSMSPVTPSAPAEEPPCFGKLSRIPS